MSDSKKKDLERLLKKPSNKTLEKSVKSYPRGVTYTDLKKIVKDMKYG